MKASTQKKYALAIRSSHGCNQKLQESIFFLQLWKNKKQKNLPPSKKIKLYPRTVLTPDRHRFELTAGKMNIKQIAERLNEKATTEGFKIAELPELRKKYLGKKQLAFKIFTDKTIFDREDTIRIS